MTPKTPHICDKEDKISQITIKQSNRDIQFEYLTDEIKDLKDEIKYLKDILSSFINKADDKFVEIKIFKIHEEETKVIKEKLWFLDKFRENIYIKIAFFSWISSTWWFLFASYIRDFFIKQ